MIQRIVRAVLIAVGVWVLCIVLGTVLGLLGTIGATVGDLFIRFAVIAGVIAGLWDFVSGGALWPRKG